MDFDVIFNQLRNLGIPDNIAIAHASTLIIIEKSFVKQIEESKNNNNKIKDTLETEITGKSVFN